MTSGTVTPPFTPGQSGWIAVAAMLFSCWSICTIAVRAYIRRTGHGPWGTDDTVLLISQILAIVCSTLAIVAAKLGYGDLVQSDTFLEAVKVTYVSQFLYIFSLWACKCSASLLIARLAPPGPINRLAFGIVGASTLWAVLSTLLVGLRGNLSQPWDTIDGSVVMFQRWLTVEVLGIAIEIALFVTVFVLFIPLQLTDGTMKPVLIASFATRLVTIPIVALRLRYLWPYDLSSTAADENYVLAGVVAQAAMHYCLISASIPCLKPFMRPFDNSAPQLILDDQHLDPTRTRALGRGNLFMYGPTVVEPSKSHKSTKVGSGSGGSGVLRSGGSGVLHSIATSLPFTSASRAKAHDRDNRETLRSLTQSYGDSDFRPDRDIVKSGARIASASEELEMTALDLPPLPEDQLIVRHTTDWSVTISPAPRDGPTPPPANPTRRR